MSAHKKAINTDEAWNIQETYSGKPHGWIQWKGTDVCMDVNCKCGETFHIDSDFVYHVKCPSCCTDYIAEGIEEGYVCHPSGSNRMAVWRNGDGENYMKAKDAFKYLWDSINAKKHPWESNPWVWVYTFERVEKPENFLE